MGTSRKWSIPFPSLLLETWEQRGGSPAQPGTGGGGFTCGEPGLLEEETPT